MRVPLDEPFLVKFAERRDLRLSPLGNRGTQELVVADAQTNHVTFKIPDPNVRIRDFLALKPGSAVYSFGAFQSRSDAQNRALHAHDPDRDYRIRLSFQLGLLRRLQLVPYFAASLLALLTLALLTERPTDLRTLALIAGPAALAASVLLAREPSMIAARRVMTRAVIRPLQGVGLRRRNHGQEHRARIATRCCHWTLADEDGFRHLGEAQRVDWAFRTGQDERWQLQGRPQREVAASRGWRSLPAR